jgi:hypothetical protein
LRRRVIPLAVINDERVTRQILEHVGLPSQALPLGRAAEEPQGEMWPTGPPRDELAQPAPPDEFDQRWGTVDFAE